jgi:hypothetical protein
MKKIGLQPKGIAEAIDKAKREGKCSVPKFVDITDEDIDRLAEQIAWVANRFNGIHKSINDITDTEKLEEALILRSCYLETLVELSGKFDTILRFIP